MNRAGGSTGWYVVQADPREDFGAAKAFHAIGHLQALLTKTWLPAAHRIPLPGRLGALRRRYTPTLHDATIYTRPFGGLRLNDIRRRTGHDWDRWLRNGSSFGEWASKQLEKAGFGQGDGVFAYTGSALEPIRLACKVGAKSIVSQVSPGFVWYEILNQETARWSCDAAEIRPDQRFVDRVQAEWSQADAVAVNSRFSKDCLVAEGLTASKIVIAEPPLGEIGRATQLKTAPGPDAPLRVLFVGTLSLAKGIQYLGEAAKMLKSKGFTFTAVGNSALPTGFLEKMHWPIEHIGHKNREALEKLFMSHHVLVFPTLCDGFGLVQVEAQAQGLPVIATTACGDVVEDGVSGFVVPPSDPEAIADRLLRLRDDPHLLESMSECALDAVKRFTPKRYAKSVLEQFKTRSDLGGEA